MHCLERRFELWHDGDIDALVKEGKCIQDHLQSTIHSGWKSNNVTRKFDQLITLSKVIAAPKLLSTDVKGIFPIILRIPCGQGGDGDAVRKSVRIFWLRNILQVGLRSLIPFLNLIVLMLLVMIRFCLNGLLLIWLDGQLFVPMVLLILLVQMLAHGR